jgi:hypothetical protein
MVIREAYSELDSVVGQRNMAPHDFVDLRCGVLGVQTRFLAQ